MILHLIFDKNQKMLMKGIPEIMASLVSPLSILINGRIDVAYYDFHDSCRICFLIRILQVLSFASKAKFFNLFAA